MTIADRMSCNGKRKSSIKSGEIANYVIGALREVHKGSAVKIEKESEV